MERLGGLGASGRSVAPAHERRTGAVDISSVGKATFVVADRFPWWSVGAKMTSAGAPVAVGVMHPALGEATALIVIFVAVTIIATALFGSCELSKRAFRLMRWIRNRPEPRCPDGEQRL